MKYYHITSVKNISSIRMNGIKSNEEGHIFVFENKSFKHPITKQITFIADSIAQNQLFLSDYAMFEIADEGITGQIYPDNVGELTAPFQWIIKQEIIKPKFINHFGIYEM